MKCNWTENDTKVSYTSYDMAMPYYKIIECNNTNTTRDKDNVNERYFCEIHLKQVKETRKLMHKNCINKEKLINYLNFCIEMDNKRLKMKHYNEDWIKGSIEQVEFIINVIRNGEFDND